MVAYAVSSHRRTDRLHCRRQNSSYHERGMFKRSAEMLFFKQPDTEDLFPSYRANFDDAPYVHPSVGVGVGVGCMTKFYDNLFA